MPRSEPSDCEYDNSLENRQHDPETLDQAAGLQNALGRPSLYDAMIIRFIDQSRIFFLEINKLLFEGKRDDARTLVHSFKGMSIQIGAVRLQKMAAKIEADLTTSEPLNHIEVQIRYLNAAFNDLCLSLEDIINFKDETKIPLEATVQELLCTLKEKINRHCPSAGQLLVDKEILFRTVLLGDYAWILEAIRTSNFPAALDWLNESISRR